MQIIPFALELQSSNLLAAEAGGRFYGSLCQPRMLPWPLHLVDAWKLYSLFWTPGKPVACWEMQVTALDKLHQLDHNKALSRALKTLQLSMPRLTDLTCLQGLCQGADAPCTGQQEANPPHGWCCIVFVQRKMTAVALHAILRMTPALSFLISAPFMGFGGSTNATSLNAKVTPMLELLEPSHAHTLFATSFCIPSEDGTLSFGSSDLDGISSLMPYRPILSGRIIPGTDPPGKYRGLCARTSLKLKLLGHKRITQWLVNHACQGYGLTQIPGAACIS